MFCIKYGAQKTKKLSIVESLRDEVKQEISQQQIAQKIEVDFASLDLRCAEGVPVNVVLWALLLKYGLTVMSSVTGIIQDLTVPPSWPVPGSKCSESFIRLLAMMME